jgi:hypothetical protein
MTPRDIAETMVIERDNPISMDDGLVIRADVYRPKTQYPVPVIMTSGPYGKGVKYQEHYKLMWEWLVEQHPDVLTGSTRSFLGRIPRDGRSTHTISPGMAACLAP